MYLLNLEQQIITVILKVKATFFEFIIFILLTRNMKIYKGKNYRHEFFLSIDD